MTGNVFTCPTFKSYPTFVTTRTAAEIVGVPVATFRAMDARGLVPRRHWSSPRGCPLWIAADLLRWAQGGRR